MTLVSVAVISGILCDRVDRSIRTAKIMQSIPQGFGRSTIPCRIFQKLPQSSAHPRIRKHLEGALKNLWVTELRIDPGMMGAADE